MRSVIIRQFGGPEMLELMDGPEPQPGPGQVRIRVAASTVSKIDLSTRSGRLADAGLMVARPIIGMGWDVAGHIDAAGLGVTRFKVGDAVVGLRDRLSDAGAHADQVALDEHAVARAPRSVSLAEAAALPLNGLTADRSLKLSGVSRGQSLLITGATGGVGGLLLELAAARGIRTLAAVRAEESELALSLGATDVVSTGESLARSVRAVLPGGADAVIDAAVLGIEAHDALRGGGTFVALVAPFAPPPIRGTRVVVQEVFADGERLGELAALVDAGRLTPRVGQILSFDSVAEAHRLVERGGAGRVVLTP